MKKVDDDEKYIWSKLKAHLDVLVLDLTSKKALFLSQRLAVTLEDPRFFSN